MYFQPVADLHTHTCASQHAYSTVTENATAAAARGLLAVACTDHGPQMDDGVHWWHFYCLKNLPDHIAGIRHLRGCEANVNGFDGSLDLPDRAFSSLELVIASMHDSAMPFGTPAEITEAWLAVARDPRVDIIGHCGTPMYGFDYEKVIPEFGKCGKVVEINESTFKMRASSLENCARIAQLCKQHEVRIVVDSDAHYHESIGVMPKAMAMLEEIAFPKELIINSSRDCFESFLKEKQLSL